MYDNIFILNYVFKIGMLEDQLKNYAPPETRTEGTNQWPITVTIFC